MKYLFALLAALVAVVTCDNHLFRNADIDGDNHLSESEFDMIFDHWDVNNDSRVDQYEFTSGWERDDWDNDENAALDFHLFDSNDDGYITDTPDLHHLFSTFDTEAPMGQISAHEFRHTWDALFDN